ncbi:SusC/RagA family TonB-linked outer membrane protein [Winogradskyella bathintestinalis]|uniref:SusC/RagA family TonB-linked outer membrane protein n=1 Tax=Winogradskyella bathintestinalis TaxID=3035208 RepID=A0ABT7ZSE3_9FLAO|nr:SusC/RagA family TonB-linked outer membrane protein [Winogradskyella bathintestinalis]MDN3491941.1 SusC/RagA family TonB-linked outer membrane protein [Winogradskyella bathintestinalis]
MNETLSLKVILFSIIFIPLLSFGQQVTGKVIDGVTNQPLLGANVIIKGTSTGTVTDFDGNFNINVENFPVTLVISSLGFETAEVVLTEVEVVSVTLQESATGLDEVVISGLASTVKRTNAANSVASLSAEELAGTTPAQTLDGALAGKFTGALVTSNSGAPGGGLSVKLRGITSINGNSQPLYIIDGVYIDNSSIASGGLNTISGAATGGNASSQDNATNRIADINPDDIENIEILKGASASAIYGSRGAAGVIIITTKKGRAGKTKLNFSQSIGFNRIINLQGQRNWTAALAESEFGEGDLYTAAANNGTLRDYEKELYGEDGFISNTSVSMSGGSEKTTFYVGLSRNQEDGIVKRTGYDKTSLRLNADHQFGDHIKLAITTNYIDSSADRGFFNNDNTSTTLGVALTNTRPWDFLFPDDNGNYPDHPNNSSNPLQTRDLMTNNESTQRFITGGTLDVNIYRGENSDLKFVAKAGADHYTLTGTVIFPKELQFMRPDQGGLNGVSAVSTTTNTNANYSAFLVHNYRTDNNLNFTTQAGVTNEQFSQSVVRVIASDLIASETNVDQAANQTINQFRLEQEDFGFYVQESINYHDKLIGTLGIRGDKSTNNGDINELFFYPKASLAVNLQNFDFWGEDSILNRFKPRIAYGEAGTFAAFGSLYTVYGSSSIDGNVGITVPLTRGNSAITPERQGELELGFDAGLFNNRISFEFTYYKKTVDDLLLQANIEPSTGFSTEWVNAGTLENRGIELGLNTTVFEKENFIWNTGISWYKNTSEMTELNVPTFNLGGFGNSLGQFQIEEGKSVTQIVGTTGPGTPVSVLGDAEPDFQMSFDNKLIYKDFTLSFLWHWKKGGDNINLSKLLSDFGGTSADYDGFDVDPEGLIRNGTYRIENGINAGNARPFVEDASYLRLREIGLYYNIPSKTIDNVFNGVVSSIKVGFSGNNLINIFDYNSYDPEVSNFGGNGLSTGVEVTPFPSSKRYMFHISAQF